MSGLLLLSQRPWKTATLVRKQTKCRKVMLGNEIEIKLMSYNTHVGTPKEVLKHEYKVLLSALCLLLYLSSICRSVFFFFPKKIMIEIFSQNPQLHLMHNLSTWSKTELKLNSGWRNGAASALWLGSQGPSYKLDCWFLMSWGWCSWLLLQGLLMPSGFWKFVMGSGAEWK